MCHITKMKISNVIFFSDLATICVTDITFPLPITVVHVIWVVNLIACAMTHVYFLWVLPIVTEDASTWLNTVIISYCVPG